MGERQFVQMILVTWPRWLPCPYMIKTLKNLLLRNQKADDLETWYTRVLLHLFKCWPRVDLDLFYGRVKFGPLCFCKGKRQNNVFFRNHCHLWFETSNRWPKWQEVSVDIKTLSPGGCRPLPPGYIHVLNHEKNCIKSDFKEIFLNLQQMNEVTRHFCWHQNFVPWGLPCPGAYTCTKSWKNCIKSDFKEIFLYPATQKVAGYYVIPFENFEILSVCPSVCLSIQTSGTLWDSDGHFLSNFYKQLEH